MRNLLPNFAPWVVAMAATGVGIDVLKLLGTIAFSALVIWLVIRILKEE